MKLLLFLIIIKNIYAFDYKLQAVKVNETTYCFIGLAEVMNKQNNGNMSNSCFVNMFDSYLVIDSGPTYQYAQQAYKKMKKIQDLPISYVVNTHIHDDHWLGNSYYIELGAKIIGSQNFENETKVEITRMQKKISQEAFKKTTQVYPFIFVENKKFLDYKSLQVELINVNYKAHTFTDLLVYIPQQKIIFAGDLIFNDRLPSLRDGSITGWIKILNTIQAMNLEYIVGGHGRDTSLNATIMTYNYLKTLKYEINLCIDNGKDISYAVENILMKKYEKIPFYKELHKQNVEIAYRMLEWEE